VFQPFGEQTATPNHVDAASLSGDAVRSCSASVMDGRGSGPPNTAARELLIGLVTAVCPASANRSRASAVRSAESASTCKPGSCNGEPSQSRLWECTASNRDCPATGVGVSSHASVCARARSMSSPAWLKSAGLTGKGHTGGTTLKSA
jgi:hypothetical protein